MSDRLAEIDEQIHAMKGARGDLLNRHFAVGIMGELRATIEQKQREIDHYKTINPREVDWVARAEAAEARLSECQKLLEASSHALRSYQYGNGSADLAERLADRIDAALRPIGKEPT